MEESELFHFIAFPDTLLSTKIRQLRIAYQVAPKQYSELKRTLPYVVCGIFNPPYRKMENFGYIQSFIIDIDHLSSKGLNANSLKTRLKADTRVQLAFTSPSEDGLKVMFRLRERCYDAALFSMFYKEFLHRFSLQYQLEQVADKRTSDVTRACFLSVDPDAFFNQEYESVDMSEYVQPDNPQAVLDLMAKQKTEERAAQPDKVESSPHDPDKEIMERIKACLNPDAKLLKKKPDVYVPDQLNTIIGNLVSFVEHTGLVVSEVIDIQYGKKLRISMGLKQAEINVFYGRRGFSVVKSPRSGTSEELNEITADLIQTFIYQL
jgi:hypothetical protein